MKRHTKGLAAIILLMLSSNPLAAAPDQAKAGTFIKDGIARTVALFQSQTLTRDEVMEKLRQELRSNFDVPAIAGYVLGAAVRTSTPDQKRRFLAAFEELLVQTYTNRVINVRPWAKSISVDILRITGTTPIGHDQLMVHSEVNRTAATWVKIDWHLREKKDHLRIVDIIILGISQLQLYRSEFASVMRRDGNGVEGLIASLKEKNAALAQVHK